MATSEKPDPRTLFSGAGILPGMILDRAGGVCVSFVCNHCRHYLFHDRACAAFPAGIPPDIWMGDTPHRSPYPGDHGIRYEVDSQYISPRRVAASTRTTLILEVIRPSSC